jgi:hypothetical protein
MKKKATLHSIWGNREVFIWLESKSMTMKLKRMALNTTFWINFRIQVSGFLYPTKKKISKPKSIFYEFIKKKVY